jgi:hypothetical protein
MEGFHSKEWFETLVSCWTAKIIIYKPKINEADVNCAKGKPIYGNLMTN